MRRGGDRIAAYSSIVTASAALIRTSGRVNRKEALKSGAREALVRARSSYSRRSPRSRPGGSGGPALIKSGVINDSSRNKNASSSRIPAARGALKTFCRSLLRFKVLIIDCKRNSSCRGETEITLANSQKTQSSVGDVMLRKEFTLSSEPE